MSMPQDPRQSRLRRARPQRALRSALVVLACLALAACGSSATSSSSPTTPDSFTSPTQPSYYNAPLQSSSVSPTAIDPLSTINNAPSAQGQLSGATNSWVIKSKDSSGATWTATLTFGSLASGSAISSAASSNLLSACQLNNQTDAVIPFTLTLTSTTTGGFTANANSEYLFTNNSFSAAAAGSGSGEQLEAAVSYSDGAQCTALNDQGSSSAHLGISSNLQPGASSQSKGVLVLQNWASPAQPSGDPTFLANIWVVVPAYGVYTDAQWQNLTLSGPGVIDLRDTTPAADGGAGSATPDNNWYFPADGSSKADCPHIPMYAYTQTDLRARCAQQSG